MAVQLNRIIYTISIICLLISCKDKAQQKYPAIIKNDESISEINFFDKKYFNGYTMSVDESTPADHPIFNYLNCSNEGYFSVHFIPKNQSLISFWKDEYFEKNKYAYDDLDTGNKIINQMLQGKFNSYNIISFQITKDYLDMSNGCTEESINIKKGSLAKLFLYDPITEKWDFQKNIETKFLPPNADNNFFIQNLPDLFKLEYSRKNISGNWDGDYSIKTKVESIESDKLIDMEYFININDNKAILSIGVKNPIEAYCEGGYSVIKSKEFIHLVHSGESGICTSDIEDSSFDIKKDETQYYIRSRRFVNFDWQKLSKND